MRPLPALLSRPGSATRPSQTSGTPLAKETRPNWPEHLLETGEAAFLETGEAAFLADKVERGPVQPLKVLRKQALGLRPPG